MSGVCPNHSSYLLTYSKGRMVKPCVRHMTEAERKHDVPYHNMIKKRIQCGELLGYYMTDNYPKIGKAMVLLFKTDLIRRPIRPHRIPEYMHLLGQRGELNKQIENGIGHSV